MKNKSDGKYADVAPFRERTSASQQKTTSAKTGQKRSRNDAEEGTQVKGCSEESNVQ
jgi:hypothetical protein